MGGGGGGGGRGEEERGRGREKVKGGERGREISNGVSEHLIRPARGVHVNH